MKKSIFIILVMISALFTSSPSMANKKPFAGSLTVSSTHIYIYDNRDTSVTFRWVAPDRKHRADEIVICAGINAPDNCTTNTVEEAHTKRTKIGWQFRWTVDISYTLCDDTTIDTSNLYLNSSSVILDRDAKRYPDLSFSGAMIPITCK